MYVNSTMMRGKKQRQVVFFWMRDNVAISDDVPFPTSVQGIVVPVLNTFTWTRTRRCIFTAGYQK